MSNAVYKQISNTLHRNVKDIYGVNVLFDIDETLHEPHVNINGVNIYDRSSISIQIIRFEYENDLGEYISDETIREYVRGFITSYEQSRN